MHMGRNRKKRIELMQDGLTATKLDGGASYFASGLVTYKLEKGMHELTKLCAFVLPDFDKGARYVGSGEAHVMVNGGLVNRFSMLYTPIAFAMDVNPTDGCAFGVFMPCTPVSVEAFNDSCILDVRVEYAFGKWFPRR